MSATASPRAASRSAAAAKRSAGHRLRGSCAPACSTRVAAVREPVRRRKGRERGEVILGEGEVEVLVGRRHAEMRGQREPASRLRQVGGVRHEQFGVRQPLARQVEARDPPGAEERRERVADDSRAVHLQREIEARACMSAKKPGSSGTTACSEIAGKPGIGANVSMYAEKRRGELLGTRQPD